MEDKKSRYGTQQRKNIEDPVRINIILPKKVYQEVRQRAFDRNISMGKYFARAIVDFMNREIGHDGQINE